MKTDEEIIRTEWFKDHKATVTKLSDQVTAVDFKKEGTNMYAVRYVFDGYQLYISGDIGSAVYWLTWKGTPESFKDVHFSYFNEKRQCSSKSCFIYDNQVFDKDVKEYLDDISDEVEKAKFEVYFDDIKSVMNDYSEPEAQSYFMYFEASENVLVEELSIDAEDMYWFSKFGRKVAMSHVAFLEGLKMIAEQLESRSEKVEN